MLKQEVKAALISRLRPLEGLGFRFVKRYDWFTRGRGEPNQLFLVHISESHSRYTMSSEVGVRFESIEAIFHRTSGFEPRHHRGTATLGAALSALDKSFPHWIPVNGASEIESAGAAILHGYSVIAQPFFQRFNDIAAVEAHLNATPDEPVIGRSLSWFRAATGIICAHHVKSPELRRLARTYHDHLTLDSHGFYLTRFERLLADLGVTPSAA